MKRNKNAEKLKTRKIKNREEWRNMPEYNFRARNPIRTIRIKFSTIEDLEKFEKLIEQKIQPTVNSYWYPQQSESMYSNLVYVDSEDES